MEIAELIEKQKAYFKLHETKSVKFRIEQLKKLKKLLKDAEPELYKSIYSDFKKSEFETYVTELSLIYHELNTFIKNIELWSARQSASTGLANFPAKSYVIPEPLGTTLIIGAWNYPYQLSLIPAISSLAAGNTVILKPSELPKSTSQVMAEIINQHFPAEYFHVCEGGVEETSALLSHPWGKVFFTGSTAVGKIVYQAAAEHLTPVTLELGGKSPTFVLADADPKMTAKRLVWSKFLNAGQTCVAPDYILVHESIRDNLIQALINEIERNYQPIDEVGNNYLQIINLKNFDRLAGFADSSKVCFGGQTDKKSRVIGPTLLKDVSFEDDIMQDEIFGPILPIISFKNFDWAINRVNHLPQPLSLYVYGRKRKDIDKILSEISFGGGGVNESVMQLTNSKLPFGGVGASGMGSYHGKAGFDTFTHYKSIIDKPTWLETPMKYAPYSNFKKKLIGWLMEY